MCVHAVFLAQQLSRVVYLFFFFFCLLTLNTERVIDYLVRKNVGGFLANRDIIQVFKVLIAKLIQSSF